ncbi:KpsF/GutQ family sugar-phosphate isomerase [Agrococcus sp. SGAir0287]|uniref:KpsF/GutQ family sugar-phosphate isomerase n=1 Tax=Agrococcus sp. SGAir0287 TaxID=2070347 RepID=UPI0010CD68F1|nr:SIS domain-containing protein [Agrococcus sp. SGAir0287]QCR18195.1 sugar isomerase [Agrococcus sp. SGAir0287]
MHASPSPILAAARQAVLDEAAAVAAVADDLDDSFVEVLEVLLACRGKVFVTGSGTSGAIARRLAHLLSVCGTPAAFLHPMDALHGTMGVLTAADVLLAISKGGESSEINELITIATRRDVRIVALTSAPDSTMAQRAHVVVTLDLGAGDPGGVIAMGSTLATAAWGDALAILLMRQRGYTWEQMLETHPGGAVGKRQDAVPSALGRIGDDG